MRFWAFPDWSGDFRLEPDGDNCKLTVKDPTPSEIERLGEFLKKARSKGWVDQHIGFVPNGEIVIPVKAPLVKAGKFLLTKKPRGVLTAVLSDRGHVKAVIDDSDKTETEVAKKDTEAAATVRRPTNCCPLCEPGPDTRANEVLLTFCTPAQRESWEREGVLYCYGQLSGRKYEVVHRHHPLAVERGKIVWDCEGGYVMHAYDWATPPSEEVLTMKLSLEHQEAWLRNSAGCTHDVGPIYINPSTNQGLGDGTEDAAFMSAFGRHVLTMVKLFGSDDEGKPAVH